MEDQNRFWAIVAAGALVGGIVWLVAYRFFPTETGWTTVAAAGISLLYVWRYGFHEKPPEIVVMISMAANGVIFSAVSAALLGILEQTLR